MLLRARIAALSAAGLLTAGVISMSVAADADPTCNLYAYGPSRVSIVHARTDVTFQFETDDDQPCVSTAVYDLVRSDGKVADEEEVDSAEYGTFSLTAFAGPGSYELTDGYGTDQTGNPLNAYGSADVVAKYGSTLTWRTAKRSGKSVTLEATARHYSYTSNTFSPWSKAAVEFEQHTSAGWIVKDTVLANSKGLAKAKIRAGKSTWRAVTVERPTIWPATSSSHVR